MPPDAVRESWHEEQDLLDPYAEGRAFDLFWLSVAALTIMGGLFVAFWPLGLR